MKQAYIISRGAEELAAAREQFAVIVDRLQAAVLGMEHGGHGAHEGVAARAPRCACGGGDPHGLRERLASEVARGSFDQAVRAIETTTGGKIPKRQAEELTAKVSQDFEAFYQHLRAGDRKRPWTPW